VRAVGFSPDGSQIVSGSDDKTLRLWDVETEQPVGGPFRGHGGRVRAVGFSPDGLGAFSGSEDPTIRRWDAEKGELGRIDLPGLVPGFRHCSLLHDGWVQSSGKFLFWVPPDNRHGLQNPRLLLTIPTISHHRATKLDFTHFQCGPTWTNVVRRVSTQ
ncbi:hypothetical protein PIIN_09917, partial [Serendipita indica DSM 11827]